MNILVTGGNGQLAQCLKSIVEKRNTSNNYIFVGHNELDITDIKNIDDYFKENKIDIVINCAAYTAVDKAEDERDVADKINHFGVVNLSNICNKYGSYLIHISTDFVFSGLKNTPYKEDDMTLPINVYGETKSKGEESIIGNVRCMTIRTSWLYSEYGKNFYKTMIDRIKSNKETSVVCDQIGTPTYAKDLANAIIYIIEEQKYEGRHGIFHYSNYGNCSWYDFACTIEALYNMINNSDNNVIFPCISAEYITKAKRPKYSVLCKDKIDELGVKNRHWIKSLFECMKNDNK